MSADLTRVPAHANDTDLLTSAMLLSGNDRADRRAAVVNAAQQLRYDLVELGAGIATVSDPDERARLRERAEEGVKRLAMLDAWTAALEKAQRANYLDN